MENEVNGVFGSCYIRHV